MTAVKVIKVLGTSEESWEDAARDAVSQASETVEEISGVEVVDYTGDVDDGTVTEYKATVEIAFPVRREAKSDGGNSGSEAGSGSGSESRSLLGRLLG